MHFILIVILLNDEQKSVKNMPCMCVCAGGRAEASLSRGPPRSLHRPQDSLKHLPVQIPHRLVTAKSRLSSPALGMMAYV